MKNWIKLKWTKYCALAAAVAVNVNVDSDIIFTIKTQYYMFQLQLYQQETIKHYQNFLVKDLKDQFIGMNINQKVRIKLRQMNIGISSNQNLLELIDCLF